MRLEYSCPMRSNTRSAPVRSTRGEMPGYFVSNALATSSATGRSSDVYQTTLPSFLAASINAGVTAVGSGAAARMGDAKAVTPTASEPLGTPRRENLLRFIGYPPVGLVPRQSCVGS